jgi:predicted RNA-binding protein YlqC (UPF0109 family)
MAEAVKDAEFLEYIVKNVVDNPDAVKVNREVDERGVLIVLDVAPEDMGMIIGRQGSTAKAIRTLLRVIGARANARVNLKINEPEGSERAKRQEREELSESNEGDSAEKSIDDIVNDIE